MVLACLVAKMACMAPFRSPTKARAPDLTTSKLTSKIIQQEERDLRSLPF